MKSQLDEAKKEVGTVAVKAVFEYQLSAEMVALKQTIQDEAYEEAVESFAYTMTIQHPNWDLSYLGDHLAAQIIKWHADTQADRSPVGELPVAAVPAVGEVQEVPAPSPEDLPEQVIEGD